MDTDSLNAYGKTPEEAIARINSYQNPDPRCRYPFTCDPLGYCWSFANHIDGDPAFANMKRICRTCDEFDCGRSRDRAFKHARSRKRWWRRHWLSSRRRLLRKDEDL